LLDVSKDVGEMNAGHDEPSSSEKRAEKSKYVAKSSSSRSLDDDDVYLPTRRRSSGLAGAPGVKREESISHWVEDDYIPQKLHSMISGLSGLSSDSLISDNDSPIADVIDPTLFRGYSSDGDTRYTEDILKRVIRNHHKHHHINNNNNNNNNNIDNIEIHALRRMTSSIEEFEKMEKWLDEQQRPDDISAPNTSPVTPSSSYTDDPTTNIPVLATSDTTDGPTNRKSSDPVAFTPMTPVVDKLSKLNLRGNQGYCFTFVSDGEDETEPNDEAKSPGKSTSSTTIATPSTSSLKITSPISSPLTSPMKITSPSTSPITSPMKITSPSTSPIRITSPSVEESTGPNILNPFDINIPIDIILTSYPSTSPTTITSPSTSPIKITSASTSPTTVSTNDFDTKANLKQQPASVESPVDTTRFFNSTADATNETPIYSTYFSNLYEYTTENARNDSSKKTFRISERPAQTTSEPSSTLSDTLGSSYTSDDNSPTSMSNPPVYASYFSNLYDYNTGIEDSELTNKIDDSVVNNPKKYEAE